MKEVAAGEREPLSLGRNIDLVVQLAAGLAAAHRVGIVHRDVKPDSVIVEEGRAVPTDVGVASPVEVASGARRGARRPGRAGARWASGPPGCSRTSAPRST